jgi:hypothetical protein
MELSCGLHLLNYMLKLQQRHRQHNLTLAYIRKAGQQEVVGRTNCLLPLIHGSHRKRPVQQFSFSCVCTFCHGNVFTSRWLATIRGSLPSRCLATIGYTYKYTDWWEGFMKHVVRMVLGAVIYIPYLIKIGSSVQKLIWEIHRHTPV